MSLVEAISTKKRYDQMKELIDKKTDEFYEKLIDIYETQLMLVNESHQNAANILQNDKSKPFRFELLNTVYTIIKLKNSAIVESESSF